MIGKETARERLDRIEAVLPTVLVEIEALRLLFGLLLDFDFVRTDETAVEAFMFDIQSVLEDMLDEADLGTADVAEQIRIAAIASAMVIANRGQSVEVDIEVDNGQEPANDD